MIFVRLIICCTTLFVAPTLHAQSLVELRTYTISKNAVWTVDAVENIIIAQDGKLTKYDKNGKLLFEQGIKQLGYCTSIGQINSLKMYVFSEDQQLICFYDNSLSPLEQCIHLGDYGFAHVSLLEYSQQTNNFWGFDQVNSALYQIALDGSSQRQTTKNLRGMLNIHAPLQLIESGNKLFIIDQHNGAYAFDRYGTLIERIDIPNIQWIQVNEPYFIALVNDTLQLIHYQKDNPKMTPITTDRQGIQSFIVQQDIIYLSTTTHVVKARIE